VLIAATLTGSSNEVYLNFDDGAVDCSFAFLGINLKSTFNFSLKVSIFQESFHHEFVILLIYGHRKRGFLHGLLEYVQVDVSSKKSSCSEVEMANISHISGVIVNRQLASV
jgi:hypothetical protein